MTGFRPQSKVYRLEFVQDELHGLEVRAKSLPLGKFLELSGMTLTGTPEELKERIQYVFGFFASKLVSWNVETEDGVAIPATLEGLYTQDIDFVFAIIESWMNAIAAVSAPKEMRSNTGENQKLLSEIPTEDL